MFGTKQQQSKMKSAPPKQATPILDVLRRSAQAGDAKAQFGLGVAYEEGRGVERNVAVATGWYRRAALQNDANAQMALGVLYAIGDLVPRDYAKAHTWFSRAADLGRKDAAELYELVSQALNRPEEASDIRLSA